VTATYDNPEVTVAAVFAPIGESNENSTSGTLVHALASKRVGEIKRAVVRARSPIAWVPGGK
jgi:hypothetical protein